MKVVSLVAVVVILASPLTAEARMVVTRDLGCDIRTYVNDLHRLAKKHERIIINGDCESACTLALRLANTCVTPRSILGFHRAIRLRPNDKIGIGNAYLWSAVPPELRHRMGPLTPQMRYIHGYQLPRRYLCR